MRFAFGIFLLPLLALWAAPPVPYYGKVSIDGINYHGSANFSFSLEDANGTEHWRNGADANESIRVFVVNGRYSVMLGGQGMNPLPPELFVKHEELYLSVSFDKGDGPRSLGPEQLITATPRALVAEVAKKLPAGAITSDMLSPEVLSKLDANQSAAPMGPITLSMLAPEVTAKLDANQSAAPMGPITLDMLPAEVLEDLNKSAPAITSITRDMLPADVLADLNKTAPVVGPITLSMLAPEVTAKLEGNASGGISGPITRDMLPADVLADLNKTVTITREMLPADVLADLNKSAPAVGPITLSMLDAEVTAKFDSNTSGTTTVNNPPAVGSLIAIPYGESAPAGYSLYQQGTPKELVWEEKAPVSVARYAYDGATVLNGKIYFAGGSDGTYKDTLECYDSLTNTWGSLIPIPSARVAMGVTSLNNKIYAIGGIDDNGDLLKTEIFNPSENSWSLGPSLPHTIDHGDAITFNNSIYLIGGNDANSKIATNYILEANASDWVAKAPMSVARGGQRLVIFEDRIWAMGGNDAYSGTNTLNLVESYDPVSDSWRLEPSLPVKKHWGSAWVANGKIYIAGGASAVDVYERSIFSFSRETGWVSAGNLPENKFVADAVVLNDQVYVIAGQTASDVYSNKVFAADLNASLAGVYDLYRKDGNASAGTPVVQAEVADGSVTASKIANKTIGKDQISDSILKYLKPEITSQPIGKIVYEDSNVSFSVTAEGKFLSYQWKKDGANLTGETNSTLTITDANATQHDGNYSVFVSNDFGSVESGMVEVLVNNTTLMNGLVAWWKFDETNGTVAYDSSGNGNDGNLTGGPTWTTGKIGGALSFDGVDDYVLIPATSDLDLQTLSISAWVYSSNYVQDGFIFEKTTNGEFNTQYNLFLASNNKIYWRTKSPNAGYSAGDLRTDTNLSSWNLISGTYDGANKKIYINSNMVASMSWSSPVDTNPNGISIIGAFARISIGSDYFLNGNLDDVRIYDRALSAAEVQALYNMGQ